MFELFSNSIRFAYAFRRAQKDLETALHDFTELQRFYKSTIE